MKRRGPFIVLIIVGLGLANGCSEQGNPINTILPGVSAGTIPPGVYSGTYTIQQNQYTQQGVVTLTFNGTSYEQRGRVETPTPGTDFQESGTLILDSGTIIFNFGRERTMRVYPAWSLDGSFRYEYGNGLLKLEQNQGLGFIYTMLLQKK